MRVGCSKDKNRYCERREKVKREGREKTNWDRNTSKRKKRK